jgi:ABC-type Mn2+/Zn2+ transport system ATPase subunit
VLAGQRIGILGANGQGKSTLVKTIAKALAPLGGTTTEGKGLVIGYFAQQELDVLSMDDGPLMHMVRLARDVGPAAREQELRDFLGRFRFTGDMVQQAVGSLSGGEKARLVLAMLVWQRPNLLLMDEPTNHLDLTTREALSMALNEFEGTVMLVSHDRALLRETCDEFWLVARGQVQPFDGDLDDYQKWLLEVSRASARGQPLPDPPRAAVVEPTPHLRQKPARNPAPPRRQGSNAGTGPLARRPQAGQAGTHQAVRCHTAAAHRAAAHRRASAQVLVAEKAQLEARLAAARRHGRAVRGPGPRPGPRERRNRDAGRTLAGTAGRTGSPGNLSSESADQAQQQQHPRLRRRGVTRRRQGAGRRAHHAPGDTAGGPHHLHALLQRPLRRRPQRDVHGAIARTGQHDAACAGGHQRVQCRAACAGMAGDDVHHGPVGRVGVQHGRKGGRAVRPGPPAAHHAFLDQGQRPGVAAAESVDAIAVQLAQVDTGVHHAAHHGQHAAGAVLRCAASQGHGIGEVLRPIG